MIKKIIIIILIVLSFLSIYFGSYLPWKKGQSYIRALARLRDIRTVQDFKNYFSEPLDLYSPIGQEEIVKFLSNDLGGQFMKEGQQEEALRALVNYIEPYIFQNNVRHMLALARMYEAMWRYYNRESDFQNAEEYYQKAYAVGPKLPPVLFGMLNLYKDKGDMAKVQEIGAVIFNYWPDVFEPIAQNTIESQ